MCSHMLFNSPWSKRFSHRRSVKFNGNKINAIVFKELTHQLAPSEVEPLGRLFVTVFASQTE